MKTKEEFAKKWGMQPAYGMGNARFDLSDKLLIDLDEIMQEYADQETARLRERVAELEGALKEATEIISGVRVFSMGTLSDEYRWQQMNIRIDQFLNSGK